MCAWCPCKHMSGPFPKNEGKQIYLIYLLLLFVYLRTARNKSLRSNSTFQNLAILATTSLISRVRQVSKHLLGDNGRLAKMIVRLAFVQKCFIQSNVTSRKSPLSYRDTLTAAPACKRFCTVRVVKKKKKFTNIS